MKGQDFFCFKQFFLETSINILGVSLSHVKSFGSLLGSNLTSVIFITPINPAAPLSPKATLPSLIEKKKESFFFLSKLS